jgi:prepilin-type processing-associated H-X9-DG protein
VTSFHINGLGTALPRGKIDQTTSAAMAQAVSCNDMQQRRLLPTLYRRSKVQQRGSVLLNDGEMQSFYPPAESQTDGGPTTHRRMARYEIEAPRMAHEAAAAALDDANGTASAITDLITVSCTGFAAPGMDIRLIESLGLPPTVARTHIGFMGCHGAFNALRVARSIGADASRRVLICAVELCSLHFAYGWHPQRIVANALFADGAAAVVGRGSEHRSGWAIADNGTTIVPDSADAMTWHIGDHGFVMTLSPRVPELIREHLCPFLSRWLAACDMRISDVRSWAVHPGGPRVAGTVAEALGVPHDCVADSLGVLRECGNMSSPTILFILDRLRQRDAPRPCVALGFGPGLTIEAMLLR